MSAGRYNLTIEQGTDFEKSLSIKNDDGTAFDLTGYTMASQVRDLPSSASVIASFSVAVDSPATDGKFTMTMANAVTKAIDTSSVTYPDSLNLVYDVEMTKSGKITRILQGMCYVNPEVTKDAP